MAPGPQPLVQFLINYPQWNMKYQAMPPFTTLLRNFRTEVLEKFWTTTDLKLAHLPTRSPRALAALRSIPPIPSARFTN